MIIEHPIPGDRVIEVEALEVFSEAIKADRLWAGIETKLIPVMLPADPLPQPTPSPSPAPSTASPAPSTASPGPSTRSPGPSTASSSSSAAPPSWLSRILRAVQQQGDQLQRAIQGMVVNNVKPEPTRSPPPRYVPVMPGHCECGGRLLIQEMKEEQMSPTPSAPPPPSPELPQGVSPPRLDLYSPFQSMPIGELLQMLEGWEPEAEVEEAEVEEEREE
jgi:hypothetical protein